MCFVFCSLLLLRSHIYTCDKVLHNFCVGFWSEHRTIMALIEEIDVSTEQTVKKQMTEEERLALATKLDGELDDFIDGLERRGYTEGWPEDRWEEV